MNDTIKRSDALAAVSLGATVMQLAAKIIAIPAATDPYQAEIARLLAENGGISGKPHGRLGWILQIDGYVKHIDISVLPRAIDLTNALRNERR